MTETPAPTVAASDEGKREAGSAAMPVARKRREDRCRSMAALEMVMSERMAEQAVEMFFADPPAKFSELKGAPELAGLKVLPGRAPVRASGAAAKATASETRKESSRIEPNGDETQTNEPQKDKTQVRDRDGEERSQI